MWIIVSELRFKKRVFQLLKIQSSPPERRIRRRACLFICTSLKQSQSRCVKMLRADSEDSSSETQHKADET